MPPADALPEAPSPPGRSIGFWGASTIGIGAIVGGGILVLAGVAFAASGPGAMLAFALNGVVAFVTAMSFAEISSAFPESGGAYTFAKKVLSVRSAFAIGWVVWFAYIVAGVLYALGFAAFAVLAIDGLLAALGSAAPDWLGGRRIALLLATLPTCLYALSLARKSTGGGQVATYGKVVVFAVIILVGLFALVRQPLPETRAALDPFFAGGVGGLFAAMGFTFIALQGFDLIAAVAGEVKDPARNIPRAMFFSLGVAMLVYLPLLLVTSTVGVEPGTEIATVAAQNPETVIADTVRQFMGPLGYWFVIVAALLSTLSALRANLLAASHVALTMARDRTLPDVLGDVHKTRGTPLMAIYASALTLVAILFMVPDLAAAGAAASLIFLLSFALAHVTAYLARVRGGGRDGYKTPLFPLVPIAGGLACAALGGFQALRVPDAGGIVLIWLGLGVILYIALFRARAETFDASSEALDPRLAQLRGKNPLVLVPIANPAHAASLVEIANALAPSETARVLLLSIVRREGGRDPLEGLGDAQEAIRRALEISYAGGHTPSALITAAYDPWREIRRVAEEHKIQNLLIGLGRIEEGALLEELQSLVNELDADIGIVRSNATWSLARAQRVLVPIGGRGDQHGLRARLLSSISRGVAREITFVTVLPAGASDRDVAEARKDSGELAEVKVPGGAARVEVLRSDDPATALIELASSYDLLVLGMAATAWGQKVFGPVLLDIVRRAPCACIILSRRLAAHAELAKDLRGAASALPWRS